MNRKKSFNLYCRKLICVLCPLATMGQMVNNCTVFREVKEVAEMYGNNREEPVRQQYDNRRLVHNFLLQIHKTIQVCELSQPRNPKPGF